MFKDETTLLDTIRNKLTKCNTEFITFVCLSCGEAYSIGLRCDLIFCESCGSRRFKKLRSKFLPILAQYQNIKLLTLTWKKETTSKSEIALRHRQVRRLIKKFFDGGIYTFEGLAQHIHGLVVGKYVSTRIISQAWRKITKSSYIVDIRRANPDSLNYVLKYVCKSPTYQIDQFETYYKFWFHNRRVSSVGIFYNYPYPKVKFQLLCVRCHDFLMFWCISDIAYTYPLLEPLNSGYP